MWLWEIEHKHERTRSMITFKFHFWMSRAFRMKETTSLLLPYVALVKLAPSRQFLCNVTEDWHLITTHSITKYPDFTPMGTVVHLEDLIELRVRDKRVKIWEFDFSIKYTWEMNRNLSINYRLLNNSRHWKISSLFSILCCNDID